MINRFANRVLTSVFGYKGFFELKTAFNRMMYKNTVNSLIIEGGNSRILKGTGHRINVWGITDKCSPFLYADEDMDFLSDNNKILRASSGLIFGENTGTALLKVKSKINKNLETECLIDVVE